MNRIDLHNPGMCLYYQKNPETMLTTVLWMVSDREMHRMNRLQYQEYLMALQNQFRERPPYLRIMTLFLTEESDFAYSLAKEWDLALCGYWVVDPKKGSVIVDPYQQMCPLPWLGSDLRELLDEDKAKCMAGIIVPDWQNETLWGIDPDVVENSYAVKHKLAMHITIALVVINVILMLFSFIIGVDEVAEAGGASWYDCVERGQFYRYFTAIFLHAGIDHILGNMLALFAFGSVVEDYMSRNRNKLQYLILYMIAGFGSAVIASIWRLIMGDAELISVGASGAIFGLIGALAVLMYRHPKMRKSGLGVPIWAIFAYLAYSILYPLVLSWILNTEQMIDLAAHVSGFILGAVLFYIMDKKIAEDDKTVSA